MATETAHEKRARKAARWARDMERTAEGRVSRFCGGGIWTHLLLSTEEAGGFGRARWDTHATHWRIHFLHPQHHGPPRMGEPRWRQRLEAKRRRTDPLSCPCQSDIEDPGPHRSFCRYHARNVASVDPDEELPL